MLAAAEQSAQVARRPEGRGFDTSFEAQNALIHKISRKIHGRVWATGAGMTYEDVYQEACLSYVQALRTYQPAYGITFSAYMGRAILNNVNRAVDKLINERTKHGVMLFCEMAGNDDDDGFSFESMVACDTQASTEEIAIRNGDIRVRIGALSTNAKRIVKELLSPSPEILRIHREHLAALDGTTSTSRRARRPVDTMTARQVAKYLGFTRQQARAVSEEFRAKLGVTINV